MNTDSTEVHENGPWTVEEWNTEDIVLQSDDFTHDVALKISGDFINREQKLRHAHFICDRLNNPLALTPTPCATCGEVKATPLRIDWMGGYICLTCADKMLRILKNEVEIQHASICRFKCSEGESPPVKELNTKLLSQLKGKAK